MNTPENVTIRSNRLSNIARRIRWRSLRGRLIFGILLITGLTALALTLTSIYFRDRSVSFLSGELRTVVQEQAETQLTSITTQNASTADELLGNVVRDVSALASTLNGLYAQESILGRGEYWDARQQLTRLSEGQWDNPNDEPASVLVPSSIEFTEALVSEMNTSRYLDFSVPEIIKSRPIVVAIYYISMEGVTIYYPNIDLAAIVGDYNPTDQAFYTIAIPKNNPEGVPVWTAPYQDPAGTGLLVTISAPVFDPEGNFRGVVAADIQLVKLTEQISAVRIGQSGYAFVVDNAGRIIAMPEAGYKDFGLTKEEVPVSESPKQSILEKGSSELRNMTYRMVLGYSALEQVTINNVLRYVSYEPLPSVDYSLGVVVPVDELNAPYLAASKRIANENLVTQQANFIIIAAVLGFAILISLLLGRTMTNPLISLTRTAEQIATGDLSVEAKARTGDEIGTLASTFNMMTARLRELVGTLEQRIADRTRELTLAGETGRTLSQERDLDRLLKDAVERIQSTFDLYYTQIYLTDPTERSLLLRSGTGEVGAELLRRGHHLPIGPGSINGTAAAERRSVIVSDTTVSPIFKSNPLLPETRSEMSVPLLLGERVVGVLDMQSSQPGALSQDNLSAFEALAGQLAIAVENATLFTQAQQARTEVENQARRMTREGWQEFLDAVERSERLGYSIDQAELQPLDSSHLEENGNSLKASIEIIGEPLGTITFQRDQEKNWTQDEIELVNAVAGQIARQIENLRLIAQADRYRAEAEMAARRLTREGWEEYIKNQPREEIGFVYNREQVVSTEKAQIEEGDRVLKQPLTVRGEQVGELTFEDVQDMDDETLGLVQTIAERLSTHIDSLRLSTQTQKALLETEALYEILAEMNAANSYEDILSALSSKTLLAQADQLLVLAVFDIPLDSSHAPNWIYPVAYRGDAGIKIMERYPMNAFEAVPYTIFTDHSVILKDMSTDRRLDRVTRTLFQDVFRSQSSIIIPLMLGDQSIGFAQGYFGEIKEFPEEEVQRLIAIASQAAIAVQSRLLLEQAQSRAQQEQRIREVTSQVFSASDIDSIMRRVVEQVGRMLRLPTYIYLGESVAEAESSKE